MDVLTGVLCRMNGETMHVDLVILCIPKHLPNKITTPCNTAISVYAPRPRYPRQFKTKLINGTVVCS